MHLKLLASARIYMRVGYENTNRLLSSSQNAFSFGGSNGTPTVHGACRTSLCACWNPIRHGCFYIVYHNSVKVSLDPMHGAPTPDRGCPKQTDTLWIIL